VIHSQAEAVLQIFANEAMSVGSNPVLVQWSSSVGIDLPLKRLPRTVHLIRALTLKQIWPECGDTDHKSM
jgi:hypothetical protein